jgi:hypothetical protein
MAQATAPILGFTIAAASQGADMSAAGVVSRVSPVQTALRSCTRDEGGPFEFGNQVLISSHWPAPGLDDTDLSESGSALELHRA